MYHILGTLGCQFFSLNLAHKKNYPIQQLFPDFECVCGVVFSEEQMCFSKGEPPFPPPVPGGQV